MDRTRTTTRRATLAVAAVALGLAAHGEAGGAPVTPTPGVVGVVLAVALVTARLGAGSTAGLRPARVLALLGTGQIALHVVLAGAGHDGAPAAGHGGGHGTHGAHGAAAPGLSGALSAHLPGPAMLAAHATVTVALTLLLVGADRVLVAALGLGAALPAIGDRLLAAVAPFVPAPRRLAPVAPAVAPAPPTPSGHPVRLHPRRGPPAVAA